MAKSDYTVADRKLEGENGALTAQERVEQTIQATPDAESRQRAYDAGVSHPAYVGYAEALEAHQTREDIEPLAARRAREYGSDFNDADFMRLVPGQPGPGSVLGQAPKRAGDTVLGGGAGADVYGLDNDADNDGIADEDETP